MINEYEKINTPKELMDFMNKYIHYGFHGTDGVDYKVDSKEELKKFNKNIQNVYGLASPEKLLNYGIGICYDQVEFERDWFSNHGFEFTTNFIWFELDYPNNYNTHTYLIYYDKKKDEYAIFEHSDYINRGIHYFKSYKEAVKWQYEKHLELNKNNGNIINDEVINNIHIYEYKKPNFDISIMEFIDTVLEGKDITDIIINK